MDIAIRSARTTAIQTSWDGGSGAPLVAANGGRTSARGEVITPVWSRGTGGVSSGRCRRTGAGIPRKDRRGS